MSPPPESKQKWPYRCIYEHKEIQTTIKSLYKAAVERDPVFQLLVSHTVMFVLWPCYSVGFPIAYSLYYAEPTSITMLSVSGCLMMCIAGGLMMQFVFGALHLHAHAKFLEYDAIESLHPKMVNENPIFWIAFVHHHAPEHEPRRKWFSQSEEGTKLFEAKMEDFKRNNWAPEMSYHTSIGARNVLMSHWSGFSMMSKWWFVLLAFYVCSRMPLYGAWMVGYELSVLVLPAAHAYQHLPETFFPPWLFSLLSVFNRTGWFANAQDHKEHHKNNHPTVYQDFWSSGFYWKSLDSFSNTLWDYVYQKSTKKQGSRPADIFYPVVYGLLVLAHVFVPIAVFCFIYFLFQY